MSVMDYRQANNAVLATIGLARLILKKHIVKLIQSHHDVMSELIVVGHWI